jgi:hypothetical protein
MSLAMTALGYWGEAREFSLGISGFLIQPYARGAKPVRTGGDTELSGSSARPPGVESTDTQELKQIQPS